MNCDCLSGLVFRALMSLSVHVFGGAGAGASTQNPRPTLPVSLIATESSTVPQASTRWWRFTTSPRYVMDVPVAGSTAATFHWVLASNGSGATNSGGVVRTVLLTFGATVLTCSM